MVKTIGGGAMVGGQLKRDVWSHNLLDEIEVMKQYLLEFRIQNLYVELKH